MDIYESPYTRRLNRAIQESERRLSEIWGEARSQEFSKEEWKEAFKEMHRTLRKIARKHSINYKQLKSEERIKALLPQKAPKKKPKPQKIQGTFDFDENIERIASIISEDPDILNEASYFDTYDFVIITIANMVRSKLNNLGIVLDNTEFKNYRGHVTIQLQDENLKRFTELLPKTKSNSFYDGMQIFFSNIVEEIVGKENYYNINNILEDDLGFDSYFPLVVVSGSSPLSIEMTFPQPPELGYINSRHPELLGIFNGMLQNVMGHFGTTHEKINKILTDALGVKVLKKEMHHFDLNGYFNVEAPDYGEEDDIVPASLFHEELMPELSNAGIYDLIDDIEVKDGENDTIDIILHYKIHSIGQ